MRKIISLCLLSLAVSGQICSQTKRIAHYSHSGSDREFRMGGADNFGLSRGMEQMMQRRQDSVDAAQRRDSLKARKEPYDPGRPRKNGQPDHGGMVPPQHGKSKR